jgi:N-hydroxyarylamine O-acetyltransferase
MTDEAFDLAAWLERIGHDGPLAPTLPVLTALVAAQSATIPFENVDVLLGRTPKLDQASLTDKIVRSGRGGYCFELNAVLRAGLRAIGFEVTSLIGRVIVGLPEDSHRPASHMTLRVDLPEGPFLVDCGFGNMTPTAPLPLRPEEPSETPHETMRLMPLDDELVLQARVGEEWRNIYRVSPRPVLDVDYEVANWFTATHPGSPFVSNLVLSRPLSDGRRATFFNGRLTIRQADGQVERQMLETEEAIAAAMTDTFALTLSPADVAAAIDALRRAGTLGQAHPFFN